MEYFAISKNAKKIVWNPVHSHALTHFDDSPGLKEITKKIIETNDVGDGREIYLDMNMGSPVGESGLVKTNKNDKIVYAIRKNRNRYTVFVKNRKAEPCSLVHVTIRQNKQGKQYLHTAWIGPNAPSFPDSRNPSPESLEFWSKHALVWGQQEIIPGTETTECPWRG